MENGISLRINFRFDINLEIFNEYFSCCPASCYKISFKYIKKCFEI